MAIRKSASCDTLERIFLASQEFLSSSHSPLTNATPSPLPSHTINLPDPPSFNNIFSGLGASKEFESLYRARAMELKSRTEATLLQFLRKSSYIPATASRTSDKVIISIATTRYQQAINEWIELGKAMLQQNQRAHLPPPCDSFGNAESTRTPKSNRPFNHEYTPLLEHFFDENPFPTHADKVFLARKSAMTYRQIHVWFQNRRNRSKKDGKTLRKKPVSEGVTLPLDTLYQRMEKFIVPEDKTMCISHSNIFETIVNHKAEASSIKDASCNPLESLAPPHAFPSSYPPSCSYDPFPSRNGAMNFGAPKWLRLPANATIRRPSMDINTLIDRFSRMNILDDSMRGKDNSFAAVAAITVIPPSAPHPALIRRTVANVTAVCGSLRSVPATASRRHVFNTPSPQSRPVTLIPTSETTTTQKTRRRKVAPLPKRVPHGNPKSHRDVTPATAQVSVTSPSPSSPSRSSSFGSDSSSQSRLFSSGSSTSNISSSLVTPLSSPSLPAQLPSPSASLFNLSSSMIDLFGDALQGTSSPVQGLQLDFNSSLWGNSRTRKSPTFDFSFNALPAANLVHTPS